MNLKSGEYFQVSPLDKGQLFWMKTQGSVVSNAICITTGGLVQMKDDNAVFPVNREFVAK